MAKYTANNSIDINDLIKNADKVSSASPAEEAKKAAPVEDVIQDDDLIVDDEEDIAVPKSPVTEEDIPEEAEYTGPGAVVDKKEFLAGKAQREGISTNNIRPETIAGAKQWLNEADQQIAELKKKQAEAIANGATPPVNGPQTVVNIYLDKAQVGMLTLTPEQQKKVEIASKIVLNETNELKFRSIKIRRSELDDADKERERKNTIIKKAFDRSLAPFVALSSGYLGKMSHCSVAEVVKLGTQIEAGRSLTSELERWQLLYDKMKYCSIGNFETFDDFLKNTAYDDYANLQFAVIVASFPENTTFTFTCPTCGNRFNVTVKNTELLRTERVDEHMSELLGEIVNADTFIERAKEVHDNAPFNKVSRISVNEDDNLILLDLYSPSAYDAIHRTYEELTDPRKNDDVYDSYVQMLAMVKAAYLADEDENGELVYDQFTEANDILEILTQLTEPQVRKISNYIAESFMSHKYTYGIKKVVCPNPECKVDLGEYPVTMDDLLFLKVRAQ